MRAAVIGAGGHGLDVAEIMRAAGWTFAGYYDDDPEKHAPPPVELPVAVPYVVGVNDPDVREAVDCELVLLGHHPAEALVHPAALVGACDLGPGSVLAAGVVLTVAVSIGWHTHLNVGASVSQSSRLGDFCTVGPGARICGDVQIGDRVFIGAGAVISNRATIGDRAVVGAGAVVLPGQRVDGGHTVVGVPARYVHTSKDVA